MEETLKTLKDLTPVKTGKYELLKLNCGKDFVPIDELKAEAVKWIKGFDNSTDFEGFTDYGGEITSWIKHFFNITEEDLEAKSK